MTYNVFGHLSASSYTRVTNFWKCAVFIQPPCNLSMMLTNTSETFLRQSVGGYCKFQNNHSKNYWTFRHARIKEIHKITRQRWVNLPSSPVLRFTPSTITTRSLPTVDVLLSVSTEIRHTHHSQTRQHSRASDESTSKHQAQIHETEDNKWSKTAALCVTGAYKLLRSKAVERSSEINWSRSCRWNQQDWHSLSHFLCDAK